MAEHTPGPWTVDYDDDGVEIRAAGDLMGTIIHGGAMDANARLIAAAPMLLQAAKALLQRGPVGIESECHWCGREGEDTEHCSNDDCMGPLARAAIAKAEGRE